MVNTVTKQIVVLARRDHIEAMRVAAGLTIAGHDVSLIFMAKPVSEEVANSEQAELLDLADITPVTTVTEMEDDLTLLSDQEFANTLIANDDVISL